MAITGDQRNDRGKNHDFITGAMRKEQKEEHTAGVAMSRKNDV